MTMKEISEKRAALKKEMNDIITGARTENRAVSAEEEKEFAALEAELAGLNRTEQMEKRAIDLALDRSEPVPAADAPNGMQEQRAEPVEKYAAVNNYICGREVRAGEMSTTENGVIATDFSEDIISSVKELSGIISRIGIVNSKGDYKQIIADEDNKIMAGWTSELAEVTSSEAKFKTVTIGHHKLGSLFKASVELINQNHFDIASEGLNQMSLDFALKAETAIIKGTGTEQPLGLTSGGTAYSLASYAALTADELIEIQSALKAPYQMNAVWLMNRKTLGKLKQLKDGAGQYIFQTDMTKEFDGIIFGKPVLVSEAMDDMGSDGKPILYGDFGRAYKANLNPDISIQVLREKYATQGAVGVLGFMFIDGRPVNDEAYVTVSCPGTEAAET